jgi:2-keto-4-pentenoate hydratase/2-oxohepta-3-ene-1,7-dioic acid hydratase in catechol pathway
MRFATFRSTNGARLGVVDSARGILDLANAGYAGENDMLALIAGGKASLDAARRSVMQAVGADDWSTPASVQLLAPLPQLRKNVFCVGRNYKAHIVESARARGVPTSFPKVPEFFSKPPTGVIGPDAGISSYASLTAKLDYEVELGVVIGQRGRDIAPAEAPSYIFGYTIVNDISARDLQQTHGQWFKGKSLDTFCPMGPCIVTPDEFGEPSNHRISLKVNGEIRQDSTTADLLFSVPEIIASLSAGTTLEPGDVIATGTPSGVAFGMPVPRYLRIGDIVEAEIEGIGTLRNPVVA